jgi:hypothetical protein
VIRDVARDRQEHVGNNDGRLHHGGRESRNPQVSHQDVSAKSRRRDNYRETFQIKKLS